MFNTSTGLSENRACIHTFKPLLALGESGASASCGTQHPAPGSCAPRPPEPRLRCAGAGWESRPAKHVPPERMGRLHRDLEAGQKRLHSLAFWETQTGSSSPPGCWHHRQTQPSHMRVLLRSARLCRELPRNMTLEMRGAFSGLGMSFGYVSAGEPALFLAHPSKPY